VEAVGRNLSPVYYTKDNYLVVIIKCEYFLRFGFLKFTTQTISSAMLVVCDLCCGTYSLTPFHIPLRVYFTFLI
jgi:hypothetical protein